jgi:hypothetical protein
MTRCLYLALSICLTTSAAWGAVALMGSNGRDWTVGQYTDDFTRKIQCLMRWDSHGRTFTYAIFKNGAVMSFRRSTWSFPEAMAETSITLNGKSVQAQRLDEHTLGIGWGEHPSPLPTLQFNAFIQSGQEMTIGFEIDEGPWIVSYPASVSVSDGWLKCLAKLDEN